MFANWLTILQDFEERAASIRGIVGPDPTSPRLQLPPSTRKLLGDPTSSPGEIGVSELSVKGLWALTRLSMLTILAAAVTVLTTVF